MMFEICACLGSDWRSLSQDAPKTPSQHTKQLHSQMVGERKLGDMVELLGASYIKTRLSHCKIAMLDRCKVRGIKPISY